MLNDKNYYSMPKVKRAFCFTGKNALNFVLNFCKSNRPEVYFEEPRFAIRTNYNQQRIKFCCGFEISAINN